MTGRQRQMGGTRERGRAAGRALLPCGLFRHHAEPRRRGVQAGRHRDRGLSATYQDARHWVTEAKSDRAPLPLRGQQHRAARAPAGHPAPRRRPAHVIALDPSTRPTVARRSELSRRYRLAAGDLFAAIDRNDAAAVQRADHEVIDPIFGVLEYMIHQQAEAAAARALEHSASLREHQAHATRAITVAFGVGLALLACFALTSIVPPPPPPRSRGSRRSPSATR